MDVLTQVRQSPMTRFQVMAVVIALLTRRPAGALPKVNRILAKIGRALAIKYRSRRLLVRALVLAAVAYLFFGVVFTQVNVALVVALFLGILTTTAAIAGFYAVAPEVNTARTRATGIGWMVGLGRVVSIVAPILVGYLISGGWQPERSSFLFAIPLATSALCIFALGMSLKRTRPPSLAATAPAPPRLPRKAEPILSPSRHWRKIHAFS